MQNAKGEYPGAVVASELAAMLDFAILPTIASHYEQLDEAELIRRCKSMAARLGLPEYEWPRIHVPCFISIDGASIHPHMRQLMAAPRASLPLQQQLRQQALLDKLQLQLDDLPKRIEPDIVPPPPVAAANLQELRQPGARAARAAEEAQQRERRAALLQKLQDYRSEHKEDPWLRELWNRARYDPRYRCIPPELWMPLSKVSPDLHSPVEHMIGTIKRAILAAMLAQDLHSETLRKGKAYQEMIDKVVAERGNGEQGRHHIQGSVRKLPFICQILAAAEGVELQFQYAFGGAEEKTHIVRGTAGKWIPDSKWT